jgi:hypothetical protein
MIDDRELAGRKSCPDRNRRQAAASELFLHRQTRDPRDTEAGQDGTLDGVGTSAT